jgi:glutathione S-transferase
MLTLYNAPQSTCSQKVRICLREKQLEFEEEKLDLFKGDQLTPEYKSINPNGVVPSLVHDDRVVTDSSVIIEYLEEEFSETPLSPATPIERAHMREWMRFLEEVPTPAIRIPSYNLVFLRHYQNMSDEEFMAIADAKTLRKQFFLKMGRTGYSETEMEQSIDRLKMTVDRMEEALADGRAWLLGAYSLADICVMPVFMRMNDIGLGTLWSDRSAVANWFDRFRLRPALKQAFYHRSLLSEQYGEVGISARPGT